MDAGAMPKISLLALYLSLLVWLLVSWTAKKQVRDVRTFYRPKPEGTSLAHVAISRLGLSSETARNIAVGMSFFASNITIAGFLVPILMLQMMGLWLLLVPLTFLFAYVAFSVLTARFRSTPIYLSDTPSAPLINRIGESIEILTNKRSLYAPVVGICLAIANILFFSYELFFAADVLETILFGTESRDRFFAIAIPLFTCSILCVVTSGVAGVLRTDILQVVGCVILLIVVFLCLGSGADTGELTTAVGVGTEMEYILYGVFALQLLLIAFGPYINLNTLLLRDVAFDVEPENFRFTVRKDPLLYSAVFIAGLGVALILLANSTNTVFFDSLTTFFSGSDPLLEILFCIGFGAVVLSSIDSQMVSASYNVRTSRGSPHDFRRTDQDTRRAELRTGLSTTRIFVAMLCILPYFLLIIFYVFRPGAYLMIISIATLVVIFAPLNLLCLTLARIRRGLEFVTNRLVVIYVLHFALAAALGVLAAAYIVEAILLFFAIFVSACWFAYITYRRAIRTLAPTTED